MSQARPANGLKAAEPAKGNRPASHSLPVNFDLLGIDSIKNELQKLSATNQELLKAFQDRPELPPAKPKDFGSSGNIVLPADADDLARHKKECDRLRKRVAELEARLQADASEAFVQQQREFEQVLDEKTETIRALHMRNQELQEKLRGGADGMTREQLDARQQELDILEERLRADEESLSSQGREMEMAMAKERADLARQRGDLQRLQADVHREVELAARDPGLRERLMSLQRRPDGRPRSAHSLANIDLSGSASPMPGRRPGTMPAIDAAAETDDAQKPGLLRRLFGK